MAKGRQLRFYFFEKVFSFLDFRSYFLFTLHFALEAELATHRPISERLTPTQQFLSSLRISISGIRASAAIRGRIESLVITGNPKTSHYFRFFLFDEHGNQRDGD